MHFLLQLQSRVSLTKRIYLVLIHSVQDQKPLSPSGTQIRKVTCCFLAHSLPLDSGDFNKKMNSIQATREMIITHLHICHLLLCFFLHLHPQLAMQFGKNHPLLLASSNTSTGIHAYRKSATSHYLQF